MVGGNQVIEFRGAALCQSVLPNTVPRKDLAYAKEPVPKTDTGGWVEYTKAQE